MKLEILQYLSTIFFLIFNTEPIFWTPRIYTGRIFSPILFFYNIQPLT